MYQIYKVSIFDMETWQCSFFAPHFFWGNKSKSILAMHVNHPPLMLNDIDISYDGKATRYFEVLCFQKGLCCVCWLALVSFFL